MSEPPTVDFHSPPPTLPDRVGRARDDFEAAWKAGQRPRIEDGLGDAPEPVRSALLRELLALELELRRKSGERPDPRDYLDRFPGYPELVRVAFDEARSPGTGRAGRPGAGADPTGRGLLLGLLALQNHFVDREALLAAFAAWVGDKTRPLGQILVERGSLDRDCLDLLEALAEQHLKRHDDEAETSLGALGALGSMREDLGRIDDADLQATLNLAAGAGETFGPAADDRADREQGPFDADRRYRILRLHARGGLGEVFVAHDQELHREVALKEIRPFHADNLDSRTRFVLEAEVTGGLEHPGIVPVYGLGYYRDGRPFYSMRFIQGDTLKDAIERFHEADGYPGRDPGERTLALRKLLGRFVDVCETLAYAHSRGVLHRDIKPTNIMLGKYGETLVVDWGLAKVIGRREESAGAVEATLRPASAGSSAPTLMHAALGTPAYMSPEQAEGRHDELGPPSDVYSLGVTLYCLLAGRAPFEERNLGQIREKLRSGDVPAPRQLSPAIAPPLEAICLKAMALRPEDRYPTPRELADDIEHWLADEPVSAYREPLASRMARWGRRHKPIVAGAAGLLLTAVVALSIGAVLIGRERAGKEEQRQLAMTNFRLAQGAYEMLTEAGDVELAEVPQMESVRKWLLEKARLGYQKFLEQRGDDPAIRRGAVRAHNRLGDVFEMMGQYPDAERSYRRALAMLKEDPPGDLVAVSEDRGERARAYHGLGLLLRKTNRFRESEAAFREAIRLREPLAAASPGDARAQQALAESRYHLAALLARLSGRQAEGEAVYRDVLARQKALVTRDRDRPESRALLGRHLNNLAMLLGATGHADEAEAAFLEILSTQSTLSQEAPGLPAPRWQLARAASNLGVLRRGVERRAENAGELFRYAKTMLDTLRTEFPKVPQYRLELAAVEGNLGRLEESNRHPKEAEASFGRARSLLEALATEFPLVPEYQQKLAVLLFDLNLLLARTDPAGAEPVLREAIETQERLIRAYPDVPEYPHVLGRSLYNLARVLLERGDRAGARRLLDRAMIHHKAALAANPANRDYRASLFDDHGVLALAWLEDGDPPRAAALAEELPRLLPDDFNSYAHAAALLIRCAGTVASDDRLAEDRRKAVESSYLGRALRVLRQAVTGGLIRHPDQLELPEFQPLRGREDFKRLRRDVKEKATVRVG